MRIRTHWPRVFVVGAVSLATLGWGGTAIEAQAVAALPSHFITVVPCRVVDTRNPDGPHGGPKLTGGVARSFDINDGPCPGILGTASGYSMNITVFAPEAPGFLSAWPTGSPMPTVSTLNYVTGQTIPNAAIVPAGTGGSIDVFSVANSHVIIDINGYFAEGPEIARATGLGPADAIDSGRITSRTVSFTKRSSSTALRISYTDNRRVLGPNKGGRWEIRADGVSCPGGPLVYDYYIETGNLHHSETVVGYCEGLSAGAHEIQVWVGPVPGYSAVDLYTGWNNSRWLLEVEEVP